MAAPMPMSRPVEEDSPGSDWSPDAAAEVSVAGSELGAGVIVKGLTGATRSVKGPMVPFALVVKKGSMSPTMRGSSVVGIVAPSNVRHVHVDVWVSAVISLLRSVFEGFPLH